MITRIREHHFLIAIVMLAGLALLVRLFGGPLIIDDAYIYFRYVNNLISGSGLVYNPGDMVMGVSSPFYLLLLSLFGMTKISLPFISVAIGILSSVISTMLIFWILFQAISPFAGWIGGLFFAFGPTAVLPSLSGMETSLYIMLIILTLLMIYKGKDKSAAIATSLVCVTRPEGILFGFVVVAAIWIIRKRIPIWEILIISIPFAFSTGIYLVFYHSLVPNSVIAKSSVYPPFSNPFQDFLTIFLYITNPFQSSPELNELDIQSIVIGLIELFGAYLFLKRVKSGRFIFAWALLMVLAYGIINRYLFPWYLTPFSIITVISLCAGFSALLDLIEKLPRISITNTKRLKIISSAIILLAFTSILAISSLSSFFGTTKELASRESVYGYLGNWLRDNFSTHPDLASIEIGAVGFAYPGKIIDLAGLVSPKSLPYYQSSDYKFSFPHKIPPRLVLDNLPPIVLTFDSFLGTLSKDPEFTSHYIVIYKKLNAHPYYGSLFVYLRNDVPLENGFSPILN